MGLCVSHFQLHGMTSPSPLQGFEAAVALMEEAGSTLLRMDALLWEGSKIIQGVQVPPDLTASLWYHLGCARARTGSFPEAAAAFERAQGLLPDHPAVVHELAKSYQACVCVGGEMREGLGTEVLVCVEGRDRGSGTAVCGGRAWGSCRSHTPRHARFCQCQWAILHQRCVENFLQLNIRPRAGERGAP